MIKLILAVFFIVSSVTMCSVGAKEINVVNSDVSYEYIGEMPTTDMNEILGSDLENFVVVKPNTVVFPKAQNSAKLYKVTYQTVVPGYYNRPVKVSGLIAVPDIVAQRFPVVSYQHGTVFSQSEAPSNYKQSAETQMAVARFAGNGYVVIAADLIGKGISHEPDAWLVPDVAAQACVDMVYASRAVLNDLQVSTDKLFLSGWSQGSFNTMAFMRQMEAIGEPITATAVASTPNDIYLCVNRWIFVKSPLDVSWLVGTAAILVNSYENYYHIAGLVEEAVRPQYVQTARDFYNNKITWEEAAKVFPAEVKDFYTEAFINQSSQLTTQFWQQLHKNNSYQWRFKTPMQIYYGISDEVMNPYASTLPVDYQKYIGGAEVTAICSGEKADHRGNFVYGLLEQKKWFDRLLD